MNILKLSICIILIVSFNMSVFISIGYARTADPLVRTTIDNKENKNQPFVFDNSLSIADIFTMISSIVALFTVIILLYNYKKQNTLFNSQLKHYEEITKQDIMNHYKELKSQIQQIINFNKFAITDLFNSEFIDWSSLRIKEYSIKKQIKSKGLGFAKLHLEKDIEDFETLIDNIEDKSKDINSKIKEI